VTALAFTGQVPYADPSVDAGGCELGQGRCVFPAEVEVVLPAIGGRRLLCRDHVGWFMLATASSIDWSEVGVRRLPEPAR